MRFRFKWGATGVYNWAGLVVAWAVNLYPGDKCPPPSCEAVTTLQPSLSMRCLRKFQLLWGTLFQ